MDFSEVEILHSKMIEMTKYDDGETIGNSTSELSYNDKEVCLEYLLTSKAPYPFAGIELKHQSCFELVARDKLNIEIEVSKKRRLHVFYGMQTESGLIQKFMSSLDCYPDQSDYELTLNDFVTPTWWFRNNKVSESDYNEIDLSKIKYIWVENDVWSERNKSDGFCIKKLYATTDNLLLLYWLVGLAVVVNSFIWSFYYILRARKKIEYTPIQVVDNEENLEDEALLILEYINQNYQDVDLSLKSIRKKLKIPENKISKLIKSHLSISYKEHLHEIRITEAKRLFKESNYNINEIALMVGFGGTSTFNRVFKEKEKMAPSEFLKKHK